MNKNMGKLAYFAYVQCDDTLWISNIRFNGIYSINLRSGKTDFHGRFDQYSHDKTFMHSWAGKYQNSLFFLPQTGSSVDFFDLNTEKKANYPIHLWEKASIQAVTGMLQLKNIVYMVPKCVGIPIVKFSLADKHMESFCEKGLQETCKYAETGQEVLTINSIFAREKIWFAVFNTNVIAAVDIRTEEVERYAVESTIGLQTIGYDGIDFWIGEGENIIRWTPEYGITERYSQVFTDGRQKINLVSDFVFFEEYVFVIPQWLGKIARLDKKTGKVHTYPTEIEGYQIINTWRDLRNAFIYENMLIVNPVGRNYELRIDLKTGTVQTREYIAEKGAVYRRGLYKEEEDISLESFLKHQIRQPWKEATKLDSRGQIIYDEGKRNYSGL